MHKLLYQTSRNKWHKTLVKNFVLFPVIFILNGLFVYAEADAKTLEFNDLSFEVPSPHIAWGKPLSGKTIDAVMIAPRFTMRDAVELWQRLDLNLRTVSIWSPTHLGHDPAQPHLHLSGSDTESITKNLEQHLRRQPDVIILAQLELAVLPEHIQNLIARYVQDGTGLVMAYCSQSLPSTLDSLVTEMIPAEPEQPLSHGIGETSLPDWTELRDCVHAFTYQNGRIVILDYPGDFPRYHGLIPAPTESLPAPHSLLDNLFSMVARAVRWAAHRDEDVWITRVVDIGPKGPDADEVPPDMPELFVKSIRDSIQNQPLRPYRIELNKTLERRLIVKAQLREVHSGEIRLYEGIDDLERGNNSYLLDLLVEPGNYHLDVWLLDRKGIVDWYTQKLHVEGWPEIADLKATKTFLLPNDSLELTCQVRPVLSSSRQGTIYARAKNIYGEIVSEAYQIVSAEGGDVRLRLGFADLDTSLITIEIFAINGAFSRFNELHLSAYPREIRYFPVRQPANNLDFRLAVSSGDIHEYNSRFYLNRLKSVGVDIVSAPGNHGNLFHIANSGHIFIPEVTEHHVKMGGNGMVREPCLHDDDFIQSEQIHLRDQVLLHWAGSTGAYSLGKHNTITESDENLCQCERCLKAFIPYVKDVFKGEIQSFQQAWNMPFADWTQARPVADYDSSIMDSYAPWMNFRNFMEFSFTEFLTTQRSTIQTVDQDGLIGMGILPDNSPMHGYDIPALSRMLDFMIFDPSPVTIRKIRSFHKPHFGSGMKLQTTHTIDYGNEMQHLIWETVLNGFPVAWSYNPFGSADEPGIHSILLPDGRPNPNIQPAINTISVLESGLGTLLHMATRQQDPIALFDSNSARLLAEIEPHYRQRKQAAEAIWLNMLLELGVDPEYADHLSLNSPTNQTQLLILPHCQALSDADIEAILSFADRGGMLLADLIPGTRNANGTLRHYNPLQEVFDIEPQDHSSKEAIQFIRINNEVLDSATFLDDILLPTDNSWKAISENQAIKVADTYIWIENNWKNDSIPASIVLNHPLTTSTALLDAIKTNFLSPLIDSISTNNPKSDILHESVSFKGDITHLEFGTANIFSFLPPIVTQGSGRQRVRLNFMKDDIVYNLVTQERVLNPHRARLTLQGSEPLLLAQLPYNITSLDLILGPVVQAGERLMLKLQLHSSDGIITSKHIVHITLLDVNGNRIKRFSTNLLLNGASATTHIALPMNISLGNKVVKAVEVLSGVSSEAMITIMPPAQ